MSLEAEIRLKPSKYLRNPMFNNNRLQRMSSDYVEESRPSRRLSPCVIFRSPPPNLTPHCRYRRPLFIFPASYPRWNFYNHLVSAKIEQYMVGSRIRTRSVERAIVVSLCHSGCEVNKPGGALIPEIPV
ncbi:hypothetical protein CEXT_594341 [Caerostris extrusa]|uniref:Uncharacterized protein n=1 Tax=Caerostris extrusa TaxID=172846 RepID=A0AAV4UX55_CAEEX|nr:hypothetical protein CEXT_594341 [Caerostris extrusa]